MTTEQRGRLLARKRPTTSYAILVDPDAVVAARAALAEAQQNARQARHKVGKGRAQVIRNADKAEAAAQATVDACYETIVLRAMEPDELEALISAHPPTDEQVQRTKEQRDRAGNRGETLPDWPSWDDLTFRPALLAACSENGMDAYDWAVFLKSNVSNAEKVGLWRAVMEVNHRERVADALVIPKELMQMISLRSS